MNSHDSVGYWGVVAVRIGGMVGGRISAVLGLAVQLAQGGTPVAFGVAGMVALITCYFYARLSVTFFPLALQPVVSDHRGYDHFSRL